jgi:hypothetical protein
MRKRCTFCGYFPGSVGHQAECEGQQRPVPPRAVLSGMRQHLRDARDGVFDARCELNALPPHDTLDPAERGELLELADAIRDLGAALVIDTAELHDRIREGRVASGRGGRKLYEKIMYPPCEAG